MASRIGLALAVVMNFSGQTTSIGLLLIAAHVALPVGSQQVNDSVTPVSTRSTEKGLIT